MDELKGSPYDLDEDAERHLREALLGLERRVQDLRRAGTLSEKTLWDYYGRTRFEQVAASNALEGSTLDVGETGLAILKGVTLTGHDPAYVRDARDLDKALQRLVEIARDRTRPTDIPTLHEIHDLILGHRPGAGVFRKEAVIIAGAEHHPPKDWEGVMAGMETWERWSRERATVPAPLRAIVLHAWLTHVHPYVDGNGRLARAIGNLELLRGGYPPIIIRRRERSRYLESLAESDQGGDLRGFAELVLDRLEGALHALERSAEKHGDYDPLETVQKRELRVWNTAVLLLSESLRNALETRTERYKGRVTLHYYAESNEGEGVPEMLDLDAYRELLGGRSTSRSWMLSLRLEVPGFPRYERLLWAGFRPRELVEHMKRVEAQTQGQGPVLFWSRSNPEGYPRWWTDPAPPYAAAMTIARGRGDAWYVRQTAGGIVEHGTVDLAERVATAILKSLAGPAPGP